jgi:hypothetical protein
MNPLEGISHASALEYQQPRPESPAEKWSRDSGAWFGVFLNGAWMIAALASGQVPWQLKLFLPSVCFAISLVVLLQRLSLGGNWLPIPLRKIAAISLVFAILIPLGGAIYLAFGPRHTGQQRAVIIEAVDAQNGAPLADLSIQYTSSGFQPDCRIEMLGSGRDRVTWTDVRNIPVEIRSSGFLPQRVVLTTDTPKTITARLQRDAALLQN